MNLFVREAQRRRAEEVVMGATTTAIGVGTGMSGKKDGLLSFSRRILGNSGSSAGQAGGEGMNTIRDRVRNAFAGLTRRDKS